MVSIMSPVRILNGRGLGHAQEMGPRKLLLFDLLRILLAVLLCAQFVVCKAETLAVLPIKNLAEQSISDQTNLVYEMLTQAIAKTHRFTLIERDQLSVVIDELKRQHLTDFDERTASKVGKLSGAMFAVLGSFSGTISAETLDQYDRNGQKTGITQVFPARVALDLRFVSVQTGAVDYALQVRAGATGQSPAGAKKDALDDLQLKLSRELANLFPLTGYVIKENSRNEYLTDLGANSGVSVNDVFILYTEGENITHPVTGKLIKGEKKVIGEGVITSVQNEISVLKVAGVNVAIVPGLTKLDSKPKTKGLWETIKDLGVR